MLYDFQKFLLYDQKVRAQTDTRQPSSGGRQALLTCLGALALSSPPLARDQSKPRHCLQEGSLSQTQGLGHSSRKWEIGVQPQATYLLDKCLHPSTTG